MRVGLIVSNPRPSKYGQGRGGRPWRRLRDSVMARDAYLCQPCKALDKLTLASEVDHIIPVSKGGKDQHDNLQAICDDCHKAKSQAEARAGRTGEVKLSRLERRAQADSHWRR